jgi:hypothetical protein
LRINLTVINDISFRKPSIRNDGYFHCFIEDHEVDRVDQIDAESRLSISEMQKEDLIAQMVEDGE